MVRGFFSTAREIDEIGMQSRRELIRIPGASHQAEAMRQPLGVTVFAVLTDLDTTRNRVPSHFSPFDI